MNAQRYNARMDRIFEGARKIERERIESGHLPNPNLTDINALSVEQLRKIVAKAAGYR